jgi:chromatin segregation and condensation protein Rec8/ScpA/Scc1 (kleisin family)
LASTLAAVLELVREGAMEIHQSAAFAPIYLRRLRARIATDGHANPGISS